MTKAVLISIRPEWVKKIASGEKTLEIRKSRPNLKTPFKCYIYCTNSKPYVLGFTMGRNARFATLRFANIAHRILMTKNAMLGIITAPSARPHRLIIAIPTAPTAVQKWIWRTKIEQP